MPSSCSLLFLTLTPLDPFLHPQSIAFLPSDRFDLKLGGTRDEEHGIPPPLPSSANFLFARQTLKKEHASLSFWGDGTVGLVHIHPKDATLVNDRRLKTTERVEIRDGDIIQLGFYESWDGRTELVLALQVHLQDYPAPSSLAQATGSVVTFIPAPVSVFKQLYSVSERLEELTRQLASTKQQLQDSSLSFIGPCYLSFLISLVTSVQPCILSDYTFTLSILVWVAYSHIIAVCDNIRTEAATFASHTHSFGYRCGRNISSLSHALLFIAFRFSHGNAHDVRANPLLLTVGGSSCRAHTRGLDARSRFSSTIVNFGTAVGSIPIFTDVDTAADGCLDVSCVRLTLVIAAIGANVLVRDWVSYWDIEDGTRFALLIGVTNTCVCGIGDLLCPRIDSFIAIAHIHYFTIFALAIGLTPFTAGALLVAVLVHFVIDFGTQA
ncbi:hypothetical protein A4X13_0g9170 [Tilletia indica]|uniref:FHA domain-containing protein n=1 Tax=Tilletia indica TaxID=43049 RepID=A0A177T0J2_9BASI|nr:hypothetical protein A4X13_0g9170 [Tilletia indica]